MKNTLPSVIRLFVHLGLLYFAFLMLPDKTGFIENSSNNNREEQYNVSLNTFKYDFKVSKTVASKVFPMHLDSNENFNSNKATYIQDSTSSYSSNTPM